MAYYHVDLDLGSGGDGSTWALAYQSIFDLTDASVLSASDIVFVKGAEFLHASSKNVNFPADRDKPVMVYGCKSGTTNEGASVVVTDLVEGKFTGGSSNAYETISNLPKEGGNASQWNYNIRGSVVFYAIWINTSFSANIITDDSWIVLNECRYSVSGFRLGSDGLGVSSSFVLNNSELWSYSTVRGTMRFESGTFEMTGGKISGSLSTSGLFEGGHTPIKITSVDLIDFGPIPIIKGDLSGGGSFVFSSCALAVDYNLVNKALSDSTIIVEAINCHSGTLIAGEFSYENYNISGESVTDFTRYRVGGSEDTFESNGVSQLVTALANNTHKATMPIIIPLGVTNTDANGATLKTIRVYVAHSGVGSGTSGALMDDELWIEVSTNEGVFNSLPLFKASVDLSLDGVSSWSGTNTNIKQYVEVSYTPDFGDNLIVSVNFATSASSDKSISIDMKVEIL